MRIRCTRIGVPAIGIMGLGKYSVNGYDRVPFPPQRITTFIRYFLLRSIRAAPVPHDRNGAQQQLRVEPKAPAVDVLEVVLHPSTVVHVRASVDLPEACNPWPHRETPSVAAADGGGLVHG